MKNGCHHQFCKIKELSRPIIGIVVACVLCGQIREVFQNGDIKIVRTQGEVSKIIF